MKNECNILLSCPKPLKLLIHPKLPFAVNLDSIQFEDGDKNQNHHINEKGFEILACFEPPLNIAISRFSFVFFI